MVKICKRDLAMVLVGLSTETKPSDAADGIQFFESDTGATYTKCGNRWYPGSPFKSRDGLSTYVRYSASADGTGMTETWSEGQAYMGVMTGASASANPADYQWILFKGAAGSGATVVQTTGDSIDDVMSQKATTDAIVELTEGKANVDGYYETLGAGTAEQLVSMDGTEQSPTFSYRPTAGTESVTSGLVQIESIKGNTVAFNQLANMEDITSTYWTKNSVTATLADGVIELTCGSSPIKGLRIKNNAKQGHKYFICGDVKNIDSTDGIGIQIIASNGLGAVSATPIGSTDVFVKTTDWTKVYGIGSAENNTDYFIIRPRNANAEGSKVACKNVMCIDLTQMFGAGQEPSTVEEFRAMFPDAYYPYNAGELISCKPEGMETVGFNQFNGTFAKVIGGKEYYVSGEYDSIGFTENEGGQTQPISLTTGKFTPSTNGFLYASGTSDDFCINLSHSGVRNGEYEPYRKRMLAIDTKTYFPDGMRSAGNVCDEMDFVRRKAVTRIGVVDLGTLNWVKNGTNTQYYASLTPIEKPEPLTENGIASNGYAVGEGAYNSKRDKSIELKTTNIWICDSDYATTAQDFKTAMNGVMLYYELDEPTETDIPSSVNNTYFADDFGTERWLQDNSTVPVSAKLLYIRNLVDEIRNVRKNCLDTDGSLDALLSALGTACGGTFTKAWDDTAKEWRFTFTGGNE